MCMYLVGAGMSVDTVYTVRYACIRSCVLLTVIRGTLFDAVNSPALAVSTHRNKTPHFIEHANEKTTTYKQRGLGVGWGAGETSKKQKTKQKQKLKNNDNSQANK